MKMMKVATAMMKVDRVSSQAIAINSEALCFLSLLSIETKTKTKTKRTKRNCDPVDKNS